MDSIHSPISKSNIGTHHEKKTFYVQCRTPHRVSIHSNLFSPLGPRLLLQSEVGHSLCLLPTRKYRFKWLGPLKPSLKCTLAGINQVFEIKVLTNSSSSSSSYILQLSRVWVPKACSFWLLYKARVHEKIASLLPLVTLGVQPCAPPLCTNLI